jgi:hypothetical protein
MKVDYYIHYLSRNLIIDKRDFLNNPSFLKSLSKQEHLEMQPKVKHFHIKQSLILFFFLKKKHEIPLLNNYFIERQERI